MGTPFVGLTHFRWRGLDRVRPVKHAR